MQTNFFSPSINIQRDQNRAMHYIPTRNGEKAFKKVASAFLNGTKCFNIIGAYGSGKSAFILALDKVLNKKKDYFVNPIDCELDSVESKFIVGEFNSFKQVFCDSFGIDPNNDIFKELKKIIESRSKSKSGLLIVIDEFGKFLEYAAKESPEDELYFIQQLTEFFNNPEYPILFITTLHQAFEDYALSLTKAQKNEWSKVKGRLVEISFNEPVEQLLLLASERIIQKSYKCSIKRNQQEKLFKAINEADVFPMRDYFTFDFAQKLFPFDILSASVATLSFQRYGQNERSLFSFLESDDYLGINDFTNGIEFYNIAHIYNYLKYNFHSLLNSRYNPDFANWKIIDESIQRAESIFDGQFEHASEIIKVIGLLSVFGRQGQKITKTFLETYADIALGINNPLPIIEKLEKKQIIRYRHYSQCYVLFQGTDFDINLELELAEDIVSKDFSEVYQLQRHFNFPIIPAKRIYYEKGTPRYFIFKISENPIRDVPEGSIDGYINLIFNKLLQEEKIKELSASTKEAILFGWFQNTDQIRDRLIQIQKIQFVKNKCVDDSVALAELDTYLNSVTDELNSLFHASFYGADANVNWYFAGNQKHFMNIRELNLFLSEISDIVYSETPVLKNELINREKLSGTISSAKNKLIAQLLDAQTEANIGFEEDRYPPEKTIYQALLFKTGIHHQEGESWTLGRPDEASFLSLWDVSENFLADCSVAARKLTDFIDLLKAKPFKLKQGFIDFWVPVFLIAKQKYFAFYEQETFIPSLSGDTLEVAMKQPQKYFISTFNLDENRINIFNRYRYFLNLIEENTPDSDSFIETIKPFLIFYKRLIPYTQRTKKLSREALRLREAISMATDPEKVFFEEIPRALGFTIKDFSQDKKLEAFSIGLQSATRELSSAFPNLVNRIEEVISRTVSHESIGFPDNKLQLQKRFKKLKKEQVNTKLRVLVQRIYTPLDDRQSWISSVATAVVGKSLDQFTDDDEQTFQSIFPKRIHELDNLTDISKKDVDEAKEEVLKLELTSFVKGVQRNLIRLPKEKSNQINEKKAEIQKMLYSEDRHANIALLIKLLQEEIDNE